MRMMSLVALLALAGSAAAHADTMKPAAPLHIGGLEPFAATVARLAEHDLAANPPLSLFAPGLQTMDDSVVLDDTPVLVDAAGKPRQLSEPSSAGLLFFGAGLIGLCYLFDALVRSRKSKS